MKIVIASNAFKGTLSGLEANAAIAAGMRRALPDADLCCVAVADGGDGTVDAALTIAGAEAVVVNVGGPLPGMTVDARYCMLPDGTAVIESAAAAGYALIESLDPMSTSTVGVGQMIIHAADNGAKRIFLGLGGTCTNDCGSGMLEALGYKFYNSIGAPVRACGKNLIDITSYSVTASRRLPFITALCDVDAPLTGPSGATFVFGPQKGASPQQLVQLETGVRHFADILAKVPGGPLSYNLPGDGAAGGLGACVRMELRGKLTSGAETMLQLLDFDSIIADADLVVTGEGCFDRQTLMGKIPTIIHAHARAAGVASAAIFGRKSPDAPPSPFAATKVITDSTADPSRLSAESAASALEEAARKLALNFR